MINWEEKAKEIVGNWGYEEPYWWKPIAEELEAAFQEGKRETIKMIKNHDFYIPEGHITRYFRLTDEDFGSLTQEEEQKK